MFDFLEKIGQHLLILAVARQDFVRGGMKLVEKWRFEIPFSSAGFSSRTSL
jgi:hypothetical protein